MTLDRIAPAKLAARIAIFGIHVAAFGAAYHFGGSSSFGTSLTIGVLSVVGLLAETVLAAHYSKIVGGPMEGLRLTHVLRMWYWFAIIFWGYLAVTNIQTIQNR